MFGCDICTSMDFAESLPIHLVAKPIDNRNRYSFVYPVNSLQNPRRIVLQHRHSKKEGGGYIGSIGGKYEMYEPLLLNGVRLHEHLEIGMLRELYAETGLRWPVRYAHRAHYWWRNAKQGFCEGEAFFVEFPNLPRRYRRMKEGTPVNLNAEKIVSHRDLLPMQRLILSELLYSHRFFCEEIPFEFTQW